MKLQMERCWTVGVGVLLMLGVCAVGDEPAYDPLAVTGAGAVQCVDMVVHDGERDREIPIRLYLPQIESPQPVVLFSHGLGGSREGNTYLGGHWSARGYVVAFLQHPGSDTAVWKDERAGRRMAALQQAANPQNFLARVKDVAAVLDQLEEWNRTKDHVLFGRMDLERAGMSGHSFGAVTTQAVSGQTARRGAMSFTDQRIKAAVAFSPSSPRRGDPAAAFGSVTIPWMLMTGTRDVAAIGDIDMESRLAVYPALPPGGKYEAVLDGAEHSAFTDRTLPGDSGERNPNHHRVILALTTAFWDAYLRDNGAAKAWLDGAGPTSVLEKGDQWQRK